MNDFPEIRKGTVLAFGSGSATVVECEFLPSQAQGLMDEWLLLLVREDRTTPYVVTTITPRSWAHRKWTEGKYKTNLYRAMQTFVHEAQKAGHDLPDYPFDAYPKVS